MPHSPLLLGVLGVSGVPFSIPFSPSTYPFSKSDSVSVTDVKLLIVMGKGAIFAFSAVMGISSSNRIHSPSPYDSNARRCSW